MRCRQCPLFDYDEVGEPCCYLLPIADETCRLLYYDKHGVVGCYVQKWLIEKIAKEKWLIKWNMSKENADK